MLEFKQNVIFQCYFSCDCSNDETSPKFELIASVSLFIAIFGRGKFYNILTFFMRVKMIPLIVKMA